MALVEVMEGWDWKRGFDLEDRSLWQRDGLSNVVRPDAGRETASSSRIYTIKIPSHTLP